MSGPEQAEGVAEGGLGVPSPEAALLLEGVEVRHLVQEPVVSGHVVVRGEESVEAAAVAEHPELLPGLPVGRRQHEQQHAQVLPHVPRAEAAGLLQRQRPAGRRHVELLTVGVVAVLQGLQRLVVDLRGGDDPQHEPRLPLPVVGVDEVHHLRREQGLAAAGRNLEAEGRQRLAQSVPARVVDAGRDALLPRLAHPVEVQLRVDFQRRRGPAAPLGQPFEKFPDGGERALLVLLQDHAWEFRNQRVLWFQPVPAPDWPTAS